MSRGVIFDSHVALDVITSRNAISGAGERWSTLFTPAVVHQARIGREKFGAGIEAFWRRIFDDPGALSPECWLLFLWSNLTA